jgi:hypothetical protein
MVRLILLWTTLAFSTLFLFFHKDGEIGFPFDPMKLHADTYIYFLFEKLIVVILAVVILLSSSTYKTALKIFVAIACIDVIDYVLFYGNMKLTNVVSWNTIKVGIFGLTILYEKYGRQ